jgi:MHS family proline/betaine transporter-like MFS transporter
MRGYVLHGRILRRPTTAAAFYTSMVPASTAAGSAGGIADVGLLFSQLDDAQTAELGLAAAVPAGGFPLGLIGLYIRLKLEDTPKFRELEAKSP